MARFKAVFLGEWRHGRPSIGELAVNTDRQSMLVEDMGDCVRTEAGCQKGYMSLISAARMGVALMQCVRNSVQFLQPFAIRLTPRGGGQAIVLDGVDTVSIIGQNAEFYGPGGARIIERIHDRWDVSIIPNPRIRELADLQVVEKGVLMTALQNLLRNITLPVGSEMTAEEYRQQLQRIAASYYEV